MQDLDVLMQARAFMECVDLSNIRDDLGPYLAKANARVRLEDMPRGESGNVAEINGRTVITVNKNETEERQRFSVCHEIAHKVLGLPSSHQQVPSWGYAKRDENEIACDVFAVELLMPREQFQAVLCDSEPSLETVEKLRAAFNTSYPATASRLARLTNSPCAFVTMEMGRVKYASMSTRLRALGARIAFQSPIPDGSVACHLRGIGSTSFEEGYVEQDVWFEDWPKGLELIELARHHPSSDTTLSLIWFSEDDAPTFEVDRFGRRIADDEGLPELTGELPWPGRRRRK